MHMGRALADREAADPGNVALQGRLESRIVVPIVLATV
jgi:hypothetical protein